MADLLTTWPDLGLFVDSLVSIVRSLTTEWIGHRLS